MLKQAGKNVHSNIEQSSMFQISAHSEINTFSKKAAIFSPLKNVYATYKSKYLSVYSIYTAWLRKHIGQINIDMLNNYDLLSRFH